MHFVEAIQRILFFSESTKDVLDMQIKSVELVYITTYYKIASFLATIQLDYKLIVALYNHHSLTYRTYAITRSVSLNADNNHCHMSIWSLHFYCGTTYLRQL